MSGTINAKKGLIGGWNINENYLGVWGNPEDTFFLFPNPTIKAGSTLKNYPNWSDDYWHIYIKNKFGVDINGNMYTQGGKIGGWTINSNSITNGNTILQADGGIAVGSSFGVTSGGILTANGATISGIITADEGRIGTWTISANALIGNNYYLDAGAYWDSAGIKLDPNGIHYTYEVATGDWSTA